jgi:hypothetical protein
MRHLTLLTVTSLAALLCSDLAYADTLSDPTRPPQAHSASEPETRSATRLEAILQNGDRRVAIISGHVVREGDRIGDAVVEAILPQGVRLARGGRSELLALPATPKVQVRRASAALARE